MTKIKFRDILWITERTFQLKGTVVSKETLTMPQRIAICRETLARIEAYRAILHTLPVHRFVQLKTLLDSEHARLTVALADMERSEAA
jgi:hypothetical protein